VPGSDETGERLKGENRQKTLKGLEKGRFVKRIGGAATPIPVKRGGGGQTASFPFKRQFKGHKNPEEEERSTPMDWTLSKLNGLSRPYQAVYKYHRFTHQIKSSAVDYHTFFNRKSCAKKRLETPTS